MMISCMAGNGNRVPCDVASGMKTASVLNERSETAGKS